MTSAPSNERTPDENVTSCDCGCACCGPNDVSAETKQTENTPGTSGCGCDCGCGD